MSSWFLHKLHLSSILPIWLHVYLVYICNILQALSSFVVRNSCLWDLTLDMHLSDFQEFLTPRTSLMHFLLIGVILIHCRRVDYSIHRYDPCLSMRILLSAFDCIYDSTWQGAYVTQSDIISLRHLTAQLRNAASILSDELSEHPGAHCEWPLTTAQAQ